MNKYMKLYLPIFFALLSLTSTGKAWIFEAVVPSFDTFYKLVEITENKGLTLCCCDLDDTVISYPDYIGSEAWFSGTYSALKAGGVIDPMPITFCTATIAHQLNIDKVIPTEPNVVSIINRMRAELQIKCIALTSRTHALSEITQKQLIAIGLTFCCPWPGDEKPLNMDRIWKAVFKPSDGSVYCSGGNKGETLVSLLKQTNCMIDGKKINTIIVIDNDQRHLIRIKDAIAKHNIPANLMLFTYKPHILNQSQANPIAEKVTNFLVDMAKQSQDAIIKDAYEKGIIQGKIQAIREILATPSRKINHRTLSTPSLPNVQVN
ncbi:MAG: hypothetical protein US49_C0001G0174 [candidate division TM6 bacterium GW2011_GWF2_37_49]|nr:MAG: hypothetical protein US49_C0001G0174 [candidate division TM6 bacterium GW2011_GWF2_37_49]